MMAMHRADTLLGVFVGAAFFLFVALGTFGLCVADTGVLLRSAAMMVITIVVVLLAMGGAIAFCIWMGFWS